MAEYNLQLSSVEESSDEKTDISPSQKDMPNSSLLLHTPEILTNQILKHYKDIKDFEAKLKEILDIQQECITAVRTQNRKFEDARKCFNFNAVFNQISNYTKKLNHLRNDMIIIQDRVTRLKHRATLVKEHQERKVKERREAKALQDERERLLTAKPVWEVDQTKLQDKT